MPENSAQMTIGILISGLQLSLRLYFTLVSSKSPFVLGFFHCCQQQSKLNCLLASPGCICSNTACTSFAQSCIEPHVDTC